MTVARTARPPAYSAPPVEPPRLRGAPLIGLALDLRRDYLGALLRAQRECGAVVRFDAGPPGWRVTLFGVFSPAGVERVLVDDPDRLTKGTPSYVELRRTIGDGLLTSEGDAWLRQRRFVAPAFTRRRLMGGYASAILELADATVARWAQPVTAGQPLDAHGEMVRLSADVIGRVLFGADVHDALPQLVRSAPFVNERLLRRGISPHPTPRWLPIPGNRKLASWAAEMRGVVERIVAGRRAASESAGAAGHDRTQDLLGMLVAALDPLGGGKGALQLTDAEIADQVLVFLLAGYETTALTLACALVELARHPDWQAAVHDEVESLAPGRPLAPEDATGLVLTERLVRETLRLYPAAHTIGRFATDGDVVLGRSIPPRSVVVVSPYATQRSPELWPDPDRFDPTRFEGERPGGHRYAWFPFGAGPRACIGAQLALLEAKLALATIVRAYRIDTPVTHIPLTPGITLRPSGPLPLRLTARAQP